MVKKAWIAGKIRVIIPANTMMPVRIKSRNLAELNETLEFEPNRELEHRGIYFLRTLKKNKHSCWVCVVMKCVFFRLA